MAPITIRGVKIDPADTNDKRLLADVQECEYIVVQVDKSKKNWNTRKILQENQIEVQEIIDHITYLCRYQPRNFATINLDFVVFVIPYHPIWKCGRYLDPLKKGVLLISCHSSLFSGVHERKTLECRECGRPKLYRLWNQPKKCDTTRSGILLSDDYSVLTFLRRLCQAHF